MPGCECLLLVLYLHGEHPAIINLQADIHMESFIVRMHTHWPWQNHEIFQYPTTVFEVPDPLLSAEFWRSYVGQDWRFWVWFWMQYAYMVVFALYRQ
jgi:hypothetical protein